MSQNEKNQSEIELLILEGQYDDDEIELQQQLEEAESRTLAGEVVGDLE